MFCLVMNIMVLQGTGFQSIPERIKTHRIVIETVKEISCYGRLSRLAFTLSGRSVVPVPTVAGLLVAFADPVVPEVLCVLSGEF